jgi:hypothetical protein
MTKNVRLGQNKSETVGSKAGKEMRRVPQLDRLSETGKKRQWCVCVITAMQIVSVISIVSFSRQITVFLWACACLFICL